MKNEATRRTQNALARDVLARWNRLLGGIEGPQSIAGKDELEELRLTTIRLLSRWCPLYRPWERLTLFKGQASETKREKN